MLAVEEAVVGVEDERRVGELALALQDPDQVADPPIGLGDRGGAAPHPLLDRLSLGGTDPRQLADVGRLVGDAVLAGRIGRDVNAGGAADRGEPPRARQRAVVADAAGEVVAVGRELVELQVEGIGGGGELAHHPIGPPVEVPRRVAARVGPVHRSQVAVDRERVVAVVEVEKADPAVPTGSGRPVGLRLPEPVQEAADVRGLVSRAVQPHRQDVAVVAEHLVAGVVGEDAVVVPVLARQLCGTGGAAERRGDREVREPCAAVHQVEGVGHQLPREAARVLVVGDDHDDVRSCVGLSRRSPGGGRVAGRRGRSRRGDQERRQGETGEGTDAQSAESLHWRSISARAPLGHAPWVTFGLTRPGDRI